MLSVKRRLAPLLIAAGLLTGCATASSDQSVCPVPVEYSAEFQNRLADELEALPAGSALEQAIIDYGRVRAELRACQ
ncbi:hypothetical protein [Thalassospira aquimaris]|uniref:Lipoprotein n=1 Tax=Thalassospira aquimaris TaxID=3037796 RepID=A0ABT6GHM4_9PROT|nr:hypothetical protein [Thalassospira sp. FZY0004]MDG4721576.1 hypothetical protein [Thalassospira sp. FZY0004]